MIDTCDVSDDEKMQLMSKSLTYSFESETLQET
jgi:hypothetical protein